MLWTDKDEPITGKETTTTYEICDAGSYINPAKMNEKKWVKNEPIVGDNGIYVPVYPYTMEGDIPTYQLVMTKEMFQEAYRKYIVENTDSA